MLIYGGKPKASGQGLPAPHMEIKSGFVPHNIVGGGSFRFQEAYARLPILDQSLIDSGRLFLEFGRTMSRGYDTNGGEKNRDVRYRSNRVGGAGPAYSLSESSGDQYDQGGNPMPDRPNMFQITSQQQLIGPIPVWAFLKIRDVNIFTGIFPNPEQSIQVPVMTGTGYSYLDISQHMTGSNTPFKAKRWENRAMIITDRYARLTLFDTAGKIIGHSGESNGVTYVPCPFPIQISESIQGVLNQQRMPDMYEAKFTEQNL